jgi:hypothetical protein
MRKTLIVMALVGAFLMATGFESGLSGWGAFNNVYPQASNPPQFTPRTGNGLVSMFGNWWGVFNVSGIFQEFATTAGESWQLSSSARHWSGDAMTADGVDDNWVVQKIAFFDGGGNEIGGVDSRILDGTFAMDVWHDAAPITGVAPAGTVKVQALILYLQPLWDGGAANVDDVSFVHVIPVKTEPTSWGQVKALFR